MRALKTLAAAAALLTALPVTAEDACTRDAMIVFDGSGSMAEMGFNLFNEPRIFEARRAVNQAIPPIAEQRRLGLLIYGPGGADGCTGLSLRFAPKVNAADDIINSVKLLQPSGDTPLTRAVSDAANILLETSGNGVVLLITDGKENCGGATCQLAAELSDQDLTVHVIGFKIRGRYFAWDDQPDADYFHAESPARCLADRTGGVYVGTETVDELIAAFRTTLGCNVLF